ncbi:MAG: DNA repair protein RadC [Bacteroidales bacterium]|uniref:JAB domain-containing protein n=1 Tax=Porphyromonas sp. TaxID=1924944 RepID=UPI0029724BC5|nr:DNA repair protein RadC [Porphyromonas sp.]MDD7438652.1 DNA repair protein RadC [Bacteroidales bacterium]MDY3067908.1 DNA repair protein RadC [Porphyromonas sp.]
MSTEMAEGNGYPLDSIRMTDIQESERPREKLLTSGARSLTKTELLAIQIGTGRVGANALEMAHQILEQADHNLYNLYGMLTSGLEVAVKGLGPAKIANIISCLEIGYRMRADKQEVESERKRLDNSDKIYNYIFPELYDLPHEELWLILLDQQGMTRAKVRIAVGGISSSTADLRVILRTALRMGQPAMALVHNHPGGGLEPSRDDDDLTERLYKACRMVGINLLDHLIFTDNGYYSYFNNGRFEGWL